MTPFEELPPARKTPTYEGPYGIPANIWTADYTVPFGDGFVGATVKAVVSEDKATDIRLRREQRGNMLVGMLVDRAGVVYGAAGTALGGPASVDEAELPLSRVDVARARLIDLASSWRAAGLQMETEYFDTARAVVYAECARELDEAVVELLASEETEPHD